VPTEFIGRVFDVMAATPQHTYQILTKRAVRLARLAGSLPWPANVWVGVSVETADQLHRVDRLRPVPAAVRFISAEPLLGPLNGLDLAGIGWLIVGGESGPGARPMRLGWARALVQHAVAVGVPVFVKQLGTGWAGDGGKGNDWARWPADLRVRRWPNRREVLPW
jgi:protein gp37